MNTREMIDRLSLELADDEFDFDLDEECICDEVADDEVLEIIGEYGGAARWLH